MSKTKWGCSLLLSLTLLLGACGNSGDGGGSVSEGSDGEGGSGDGEVTIDVYQFKVEFREQFEELIAQYEEENPDVTINVETVGGGNDYGATLKSKIASGEEPDIFNIGGPQDYEDHKDRIAPIEDSEAVDTALDGTLDAVTIDDQVYGIPYNLEGYGLIYNKQILDEAGINPEELTTMEDLQAATEKLDSMKEELGLDAVYAFPGKERWVYGNHTSSSFLAPEFNNNVMDAFAADTVEFELSEELKTYIDMQAEYSVTPVLSLDYSQQVEALYSMGKVAMIQQGNWAYPSVEQIAPEVAENSGILPIPVDGESKMPVGVPQYWVVNSGADEEVQTAAVEFLDWMYTSDAGKEIVLNEFNFIPAFENYDTSQISDPLSKEIYEYTEEGNTSGWVFLGYPTGFSEDVFGNNVQQYLSDEITWDEAMENSKEYWEENR
ncbi:ABC transporter substrate-binding protein [Salinicoccus carnicancri]|uniref:ABC transporter substrate-binding protein n=1 Tax=Salinicoccus carnicancri TaxID=558170 RepID=UPI0003197A12|nr:extracellular solute-binding protein [Salinicoccus carnicancri]